MWYAACQAVALEVAAHPTAAAVGPRHAAATLRQQGRTGARHGRAYREVSLLSDDSCGGMLPVRGLSLKELHTQQQQLSAHAMQLPHCGSRAATAPPHGWTYRKVSWFSDDSCDGMLPVRRLFQKSLHASGSR
jgi:hypothetical protein